MIAGDALGVSLGGAGLYPALPPPDVDLAAGLRSMDLLAGFAPAHLLLAHAGPVADPGEAIATARDRWRLMGEAGRAASGPERIADEIERLLPVERVMGDPEAVALWRWLGWGESNVDGIAGWVERAGADEL